MRDYNGYTVLPQYDIDYNDFIEFVDVESLEQIDEYNTIIKNAINTRVY